MTIRWTLSDGVSTYTFPLNPNEMGSLSPQWSITTTPAGPKETRIRAVRAPKTPFEWSFSGKARSQQQYDDLLTWSNKAQLLTLTDHHARSWKIVIRQFRPTDLRRPGNITRWSYEVTTYVLERLA